MLNQINNRKQGVFITPLLLILLLSSTTLFTGCKKENYPGHSNEFDSMLDERSMTGISPDIIVQEGMSIQAAVNNASPGAVIHIKPGVYAEAIIVNKANIKLIGLTGEHNQRVIIQNPGDVDDGIRVLDAGDGFELSNVTVQNFGENGVFLVRVNGFKLSHVTTINNGEYGLFPVRCQNGVIEHCAASGHTDSGIYIGQSTKITIVHNRAFSNIIGFEIENSSDIVVEKNHSYNNVCGILAVLLPGLTIKTSSNIFINNNHVNDNNNVDIIPGQGLEGFVPRGSGILVVGTDNTVVADNKINENRFTGIALVSTLVVGALAGIPPEAFDIEPNPDGTRITGNHLNNNGTQPPVGLPLPGADLLWDGSGTNNCWSNNKYSISVPSVLPACN
jgi:parallel beta-helix repeat protein